MAESNFVDYVKIYCRSGKGGRGSMHLRHVKYNPNGGPDGGDGGDGGSVYLRANHNYWTLLHLKYERHVRAEHGGNGGRDKCHGTKGKDVYIDVPCGTVVYNAETGKYVCDVMHDGQEVLLLKGGRGGLGNFQFRTATNQAPRYAQPGEPMQEMTIILELKLLADVGLRNDCRLLPYLNIEAAWILRCAKGFELKFSPTVLLVPSEFSVSPVKLGGPTHKIPWFTDAGLSLTLGWRF